MTIVAVPYHLDERHAEFDVGVPVDHELIVDLPVGDPWQRLGLLYEQVATLVSRQAPPVVVVSGDCTTSLGVLAGLQRAGHDPGIVWFDAHADFHTEDTTTSGYLGGMPLALAVGVGTLTLPKMLGLRPVSESRAVLVDARDTDPGEHILLEQSLVRRVRLEDLDDQNVPEGDVYLHVDLDVCDPDDVPDLLFPVAGGPSLSTVLAAAQHLVATGRVAAVGVGATWRRNSPAAPAQRAVVRRLVDAISV